MLRPLLSGRAPCSPADLATYGRFLAAGEALIPADAWTCQQPTADGDVIVPPVPLADALVAEFWVDTDTVEVRLAGGSMIGVNAWQQLFRAWA
jgi:hypothetical protein